MRCGGAVARWRGGAVARWRACHVLRCLFVCRLCLLSDRRPFCVCIGCVCFQTAALSACVSAVSALRPPPFLRFSAAPIGYFLLLALPRRNRGGAQNKKKAEESNENIFGSNRQPEEGQGRERAQGALPATAWPTSLRLPFLRPPYGAPAAEAARSLQGAAAVAA